MPMSPEAYEQHVAATLRREGWTAEVTGRPGDGGVDVIAERDGRRVAVQVKRYGGCATRVTAKHVRDLPGAALLADCEGAMLVTDGQLTDDAALAAAKLDVEVRHLPAGRDDGSSTAISDSAWTFDAIWTTRVMPMVITGVPRPGGRVSTVLSVDASGVRRVGKKGTRQPLDIDVFRWAITTLLAARPVTAKEIRTRSERSSAFIFDLLVAIPEFEQDPDARLRTVRLREHPTTPVLSDA
jgi:hypothetical protein